MTAADELMKRLVRDIFRPQGVHGKLTAQQRYDAIHDRRRVPPLAERTRKEAQHLLPASDEPSRRGKTCR